MTQSIDEIIKGRRSIKKFQEKPVDIEEIIELLEVAKWAPNHKMTEPWRFLLYSGNGKEKFIEAFAATQGKGEDAEEKTAKSRLFPFYSCASSCHYAGGSASKNMGRGLWSSFCIHSKLSARSMG